jgi:hypothetical protein
MYLRNLPTERLNIDGQQFHQYVLVLSILPFSMIFD